MLVTRGLVFAASLILIPAAGVALAQTIATSFNDLPALIKPGDTVFVTDVKGRSLTGRIGELMPTSLELTARRRAPDGTEPFVTVARFSEPDVRQIRVQRPDSVVNGTLIVGLGVALGIAALPAAAIFCNPNYEDGMPLSTCLSFLGIVGGIGAGTGVAIDAARVERRMVYYQASVRF